jgi:glycosyltransferase involved in cell wall biosynthesis
VERDALLHKSLTFTIAICSLNGEKRLPATLKNLLDKIPSGTKVIVVDDGSTDRTSAVARDYGAFVISHKENFGYGQARQSAVEACVTDILAFIDDECLVSPEWFLTLQKDWQLMYLKIAALAGPMIPTCKGVMKGYLNRNNPFAPIRLINDNQSHFRQRLNRYLFPNNSLYSDHVASAANGNLSLSISAVSQISGYNTNFSFGGEDEDLCARIRKKFGSEAIYFDEELWLTHDTDESLSTTLQRNYRYGRTSATVWMDSGGIPTFLPLPIFFILSLFLFIAPPLWFLTMAFLVSYPIVVSRNKLSKKIVSLLSNLMDPYLRLILEIAHNLGFIFAFIPRIFSLRTGRHIL